jgi:hypothetical protein
MVLSSEESLHAQLFRAAARILTRASLEQADYGIIGRPRFLTHFRFLHDEATGEIHGEYYVFCDRARDAGFGIWSDVKLSLEIGHVTDIQIFRKSDRVGSMPEIVA